MKKKIITIALAIVATIGVFKLMNETENYYTKNRCEVVSYCVVEDRQGNRYHCNTVGYKVGDTVSLKMCTNGTEDPTDDYAIEIK